MEDEQKKNLRADLILFMKSTGCFRVDSHVTGTSQVSVSR